MDPKDVVFGWDLSLRALSRRGPPVPSWWLREAVMGSSLVENKAGVDSSGQAGYPATMKLISWNVCELGTPREINRLRNSLRVIPGLILTSLLEKVSSWFGALQVSMGVRRNVVVLTLGIFYTIWDLTNLCRGWWPGTSMRLRTHLKSDEGNFVQNRTDPVELISVANRYFKELFQSSNPGVASPIFNEIEPQVTDEMNESLLSHFRDEEVWHVIKGMAPLKASGMDEFPAVFYQKYWHVIVDDIV
ncbi:hypothetical protein F3Y22_tig00111957pilonHSYRG00040 [Hibiscus syriacus]|uniref:Reverse transcriptase n=1 Tax=Hibiscus syriacus TaxID=106335 RepID=A0A6A2X7V8_HIBSY|nr:hypothetical protein F3Y22_tig00111957pilonHSYRG00040 [Hibiscus syriacus]